MNSSSCVLTAEVVVRSAQIIGRGVGWHAGEEEGNTDQHYLCSAATLNPLSLDGASASLITLVLEKELPKKFQEVVEQTALKDVRGLW